MTFRAREGEREGWEIWRGPGGIKSNHPQGRSTLHDSGTLSNAGAIWVR